MLDYPGVFNDEQKRALTLLRVIWAVLLLEVIALGIVVYLILVGRYQGAPMTPPPTDQTFLMISLAAVFIGGGVGYFVRMQTYKKHWVGNRIAKPGYFAGNLLLFAFIEIGAIVAVICAYLAGGVGQELLALVLCLILLGLNFPNGRPMLPHAGQMPDSLMR